MLKRFTCLICVLMLIISLGTSVYAKGFRTVERENNDTFEKAQGYWLPGGGYIKIYGLVSPSDKVDWIKILTEDYGDISNISLDIRCNADIDLFMYDENKKLIASSTNGIKKDEEISGYFLQANKEYYFKIVYLDGGMPAEPNYSFSIEYQ